MPFLGECTLGHILLGDSRCDAVSPQLIVTADWNADGHAGNGLTSRGEQLTISRGIEPLYGRAATGVAQIALRNTDGRFSPRNSASDHYPLIVTGRKIQASRRTSGGTLTPIFTGSLRQVQVDSDPSVLRANFDAHDLLGKLARTIISTPLYVDQRSDQLISALLALAGWTGATNLETGAKTFPYASWRKTSALDAIQQVVDSELGLFFIAADGTPTFHHRYYQLLATTPAATLNNAMHGLTAWLDQDDIYNEAQITVHPRVVGEVGVLWAWEEAPFLLLAGASLTLEAEFADPNFGAGCEATGLITPVSGTDFTANTEAGGGGTNKTSLLDVSFTAYGQHAVLTITNLDSVAFYVTLLRVRGQPITKPDTITVRAVNADSVARYEITRTFALDQPLEVSADVARDAANYVINAFGDPLDRIALRLQPQDAARLDALLGLDLDSRIGLTQANAGLSNAGFFVYNVRHQIGRHPAEHAAHYLARSAPTYNLVILNSGSQTFADLLGY